MAEKMEILVEKRRRGARSNQKLKILYLAKILLDNTDANHDITLQEIIDKLSANNVTAERKSLYDDIARLDEFGIKIKKTQYGKTYHYQVVKRDFELAELKLLVDSVAAAKFITEEKSNELIKKIEHLTSKHNATMLQRQVYVAGRVKSMNNGIMENVDAIHTAIAENSKISFQYFQWNVKKEAELKRDGKRYEVSPYGAGKTAASTAVKAAGTARKISFLSTAAGKAVIGIVATASIASAVTVGVISYNKSNDKNATVQENVPAVEEVPVNADQPIDGVGEDTETTDAPEDENGSEKYADIPESVLPSSVRNDKDYFEFWDEPVKATCWIDGVKGTIYADWDKTQIIKEVTYDVDGYEDELLIIGCTLDGGTHAIAIYNGQYVVVNDAMWDHWYNGKSSAFD